MLEELAIAYHSQIRIEHSYNCLGEITSSGPSPTMTGETRLLYIKEAWNLGEDDEKWKGKHLTLTAYRGYAAYFGTLPLSDNQHWPSGEYTDVEDDMFNSLVANMEHIPESDIYPVYDTSFRQFCPKPPMSKQSAHFLKPPNITSWQGGHSDEIARTLLLEAQTNEALLANAHPHLGTYLGCVVYNDRIVRLAFPKYKETLADRIAGDSMSKEEQRICIQSIEDAARHLHSIGYAHNDISACNIMFDESGAAKLIDLDACAPLGSKIRKGGVVGGWRGPQFWKEEFVYSSIECDILSIQYIRKWLNID